MASTRSPADAGAARSADALLLEATLDSMPYGFSIWDEDERLVLWNRRYVEIYGLPGESLSRGMTLAQVCEITVAAGNHPGISAAELLPEYSRRLKAAPAAGTPFAFEKQIRGRTIKTTYAPTAGLGCVVTHEDVTREVLRQRDL